jgi:hypothetical protein
MGLNVTSMLQFCTTVNTWNTVADVKKSDVLLNSASVMRSSALSHILLICRTRGFSALPASCVKQGLIYVLNLSTGGVTFQSTAVQTFSPTGTGVSTLAVAFNARHSYSNTVKVGLYTTPLHTTHSTRCDGTRSTYDWFRRLCAQPISPITTTYTPTVLFYHF